MLELLHQLSVTLEAGWLYVGLPQFFKS